MGAQSRPQGRRPAPQVSSRYFHLAGLWSRGGNSDHHQSDSGPQTATCPSYCSPAAIPSSGCSQFKVTGRAPASLDNRLLATRMEPASPASPLGELTIKLVRGDDGAWAQFHRDYGPGIFRQLLAATRGD